MKPTDRETTQERLDRALVECKATAARVVARELARQRRYLATRPVPAERGCERCGWDW